MAFLIFSLLVIFSLINIIPSTIDVGVCTPRGEGCGAELNNGHVGHVLAMTPSSCHGQKFQPHSQIQSVMFLGYLF